MISCGFLNGLLSFEKVCVTDHFPGFEPRRAAILCYCFSTCVSRRQRLYPSLPVLRRRLAVYCPVSNVLAYLVLVTNA